MLPGKYNLPTGYRGDSYGPISFSFFDCGGNPIDFDGSTGALQVKKFESSPTVVGWYTTDGSMDISGNKITLLAKNGDCMKIYPGTYNFDLQIMSGFETKTYVRGLFPIQADITEI